MCNISLEHAYRNETFLETQKQRSFNLWNRLVQVADFPKINFIYMEKLNRRGSEKTVQVFFFFFFCLSFSFPKTHNSPYRAPHFWNLALVEIKEFPSLTPLYQFHLLHRYIGISRAISVESSLLHIASDRTWTGKLCFPSAKSLTAITTFGICWAGHISKLLILFTANKWSFPLRISLVNVTKSAVWLKKSFFV